jgi:hypothetical protein
MRNLISTFSTLFFISVSILCKCQIVEETEIPLDNYLMNYNEPITRKDTISFVRDILLLSKGKSGWNIISQKNNSFYFGDSSCNCDFSTKSLFDNCCIPRFKNYVALIYIYNTMFSKLVKANRVVVKHNGKYISGQSSSEFKDLIKLISIFEIQFSKKKVSYSVIKKNLSKKLSFSRFNFQVY